jgi:hypothetical protein
MQKRNNQRKLSEKNKNKQFKQMAPLLKSFPSQVVAQIKIPGVPVPLVTTVTTGVIATAVQIAGSTISNFVARFNSTFVEYRIVRAKFKVNNFSSANTGLYTMWVDNKSGIAPTSAEAQSRSARQFPCSGPSSHTLIWTNQDLDDLDYKITSSTTTIGTFKIYTDATSFGSSISAVQYGSVTSEFYVQFRDLV